METGYMAMEEEKIHPYRLSSIFIGLLLLLLSTTAVWAQSSSAQLIFNPIEENDTPLVQDSDFPSLTVSLTPLDQASYPIQNLQANQFTLLENDLPIENFTFESATDSSIPTSVILLIDTNQSMRTDLAEVKSSAINLLDLLSEVDETAVIPFGTPSDESIDFSANLDAQTNLINAMTVDEGAERPLFDALQEAIELSQTAEHERRVILLLTDGEDESSTLDAVTVTQNAVQNGVPIFTVGLGSNVDAEFLESIATETGGRYRNVARGSEFINLASLAVTQLKQVYRLSYQTAVVSDNTLNNLSITVNTADEQLTNSVEFRARYPIVPLVQQVDVQLATGETVSLDDLSEVQGLVRLTPQFIARNEIARVDYFVGESPNPIFSATEPPYSLNWDTNNLPSNVLNTLRIQVVDATSEGNIGQFERYILVGECGLVCRYQQTGDLTLFYFIAAAIGAVLLLAAGYFFLNRNRTNKLAEIEEYTAPPAWFERVESFTAQTPSRPATTNQNGAIGQPNVEDGDGTRAKPATAGVKPPFSPSRTDFHGAVREPAPAKKRPSRPAIRHKTIRKTPNGTMPLKNNHAVYDRTEMLPKHRNRLLAYLKDEETQREYILYGNTTIGRAPDNKIVLDDASVSSYHAQVKLKHSDYIISDLKATNPTQVNDQIIQNYTLKNGDIIEIGRKLLTFRLVK